MISLSGGARDAHIPEYAALTSLAASYTEEHVQSCSAERLINITSVIILIVSIFQLVPDC